MSLINGSLWTESTMTVTAPRRDFEESPALEIAGDMVAVIGGSLYGDVSDTDRALHVTLVDRTTGLVHSVSYLALNIDVSLLTLRPIHSA